MLVFLLRNVKTNDSYDYDLRIYFHVITVRNLTKRYIFKLRKSSTAYQIIPGMYYLVVMKKRLRCTNVARLFVTAPAFPQDCKVMH